MKIGSIVSLLPLVSPLLWGAEGNLTEGARITASSNRDRIEAALAIDGKVMDSSRWLAAVKDPAPWLEIEFPAPVAIGTIDVFSGYEEEPPTANFGVSFEISGKWISPPEGQVRGNFANPWRLATSLENVSRVRIAFPPEVPGKIREIAVYGSGGVPPRGAGLTGDRIATTAIMRDIHQIALNQVGFKTSQPKRFTAPLSADGTKFLVRKEKGKDALFKGVIRGHIGDFSDFRPEDSAENYVVDVSGGELKDNTSDPFLIRGNLWQEHYWQPAVDFLIDTRSVVGTHPSAYGGCPWRDGTYYDYILPALTLNYLSDIERMEAMPRQIDWAADKARILDPGFKFDPKNPHSEKALPTARKYYTDFEPPHPDAPDAVKLIHWGTCFYLIDPRTADPSGDPAGESIHFQTVEQIAYVVWAWPQLQKWLPVSFYERCRDFCFQHWDSTPGVDGRWTPEAYDGLDKIDTRTPMSQAALPFKGRHAPGNSIGANLKMYEVALREQRPGAERFMENAYSQTDWIIKNLDWNDPWTTKGQRMSEHRTIPNLVWFLILYPEKAPPGLKEKIRAWAEVALRRSDNLWDFRKYDDGGNWTVPKLNDVGNCAAFPAIAISASWMVDDPVMKKRLRELAISHVDYLFGRNPRLATAFHKPLPSFPTIERGWPKGFPENLCARLELCRGSISSSPGSEMFPFNPEGEYRHPEGWVNYGAAWCISLAYLKFDDKMSVEGGFKKPDAPASPPPR